MIETDRPVAPDPFAPDHQVLPPIAIGGRAHRRRLPRHRHGEAFLKGPIPYAWVATACRLPGSGLHVATAIRFLRGRYGRTIHWGVETIARGLGLSCRSVQRGLHAAEEAGLVSASREPGCKPTLCIQAVPELQGGPGRPPLYGPIPWAWLLPALRLPGPSLRVAMACWLSVGRGQSPVCELALSEWSGLGLGRDAASRGLESLRLAGLASVDRRVGMSPVVLITSPSPE